MKRKVYTPEFKLRVVIESFQRDTTIREVGNRFGVHTSQINQWRNKFKKEGATVFLDQRNPRKKAMAQGYEPGQSPEDLKKIIGELTVQNEILKKVQGLLS